MEIWLTLKKKKKGLLPVPAKKIQSDTEVILRAFSSLHIPGLWGNLSLRSRQGCDGDFLQRMKIGVGTHETPVIFSFMNVHLIQKIKCDNRFQLFHFFLALFPSYLPYLEYRILLAIKLNSELGFSPTLEKKKKSRLESLTKELIQFRSWEPRLENFIQG